jgi:hypothetical protein
MEQDGRLLLVSSLRSSSRPPGIGTGRSTERIHGGALQLRPAISDFAGRELLRHEGKKAIGIAVAAMIQPGQMVILDGGTTAGEIARRLPLELQATVATHSSTIALEPICPSSLESDRRTVVHAFRGFHWGCCHRNDQLDPPHFEPPCRSGDYRPRIFGKAETGFTDCWLEEVSGLMTERTAGDAQSSLIRKSEFQ